MGHLALSNTETLQLVGSLALLFTVAHLLGWIARRVRQPAVVGYLLAGLVLGPSGLGAAWPQLASFLLPSHGKSNLLGAVIEFSLLMVLITLGAETDVPLIRRLGRRALGVTTSSIVLPLVAGSATAYALSTSLVIGHRLSGAVLVGGALGVSSLPIIARLVDELRISRRDVGQLALATAAANDVYGLVLLAVVSATVTTGGTAPVVRAIAGLVALVALTVLFGQRFVDYLLEKIRHGGPNATGSVAVAFAVAFGAAAAMQAIGVEAALGAFFAGVLLGRSRFQHGDALARLRSFSDAVFAPLYFASAGLLIDLKVVSSWQRLVVVVGLFGVAVLSKALGTGIAGRWLRLHQGENRALMILLNGRGALQVIIATAGLRMGLLSEFAYTAVLLVSIVSSVLVAPLLRRLVGDWEGSEEERRRLAHEERIESHLLVREQRLLVPELPGTDPRLAATLFDRAWPDAAELTVLSSDPGRESELTDVARPVRWRAASSTQPLVAALDEARLGYGVLGIGISPTAHGLPPVVADLLNGSPLPSVIIRPAPERGQRMELPRHIAVATTGTTAGIAGEELASSLAHRHGARLHIVHVTPDDAVALSLPQGRALSAADAPGGVLDKASERARKAGLRPRIARERALSVSRGLLDYAQEHGIDLLVVGARLRRVGDAPFLGYTVEELLGSPLPVALIVFPDAPPGDLDQPYLDPK
ncbi:MAG: cation:proton antiporter [Actinomycetota bacterium]|nr:cation:proton antiporter [Actinomycetota bacterium]MDA8358383.1 cation:proton antiporter [Actinomycetota bacterium]